MPALTPTEVLALMLLLAALFLVPSALAYALFSLARTEREPTDPPIHTFPRRSPRRVTSGVHYGERQHRRLRSYYPRRFGNG